MIIIIRKNPKLGNYLHYLHQAEARDGGKEQILVGYHQVQVGTDQETGAPIVGNGEPIYEDGDDLFAADWDEAWGVPPTDEDLEAWEEPEPEPEPTPVTDVEILYKKNADRLNSDEAKRTGRAVDPDGSVPVARAMAATAMLYGGWSYPSEADLSKGINPQILQAIYADPTMKTSEESSADQKRRVLHFTLVMLEGQKFGLDYQGELGAYERTASGQFRAKIKDDKTRDWLELPCPKMHKAWPEFPTVRDMFLTVMA